MWQHVPRRIISGREGEQIGEGGIQKERKEKILK
jgi:hypothetical protein